MVHAFHAFVFATALIALTGNVASANTLVIGNKGEDSVSFVDLDSGTQCARVATGKAPHEIAISPDGTQAAVVAYGGTTIDIFDLDNAKLVNRIDIVPNAGPHGMVWLTSDRIVVAADKSNSLIILNPRKGSFKSVSTGQRGSHMVVTSPDNRFAYVPNILSGTVSVIDLETAKKTRDIEVGGNPEGAAISRDGKYLWVGDNSKPQVRVIDLKTGETIVALASDSVAFRVGISPDGRTAVTSNLMAGTINLFDVVERKPLHSIKISGSPKAMQVTMAFSADSRRVYVAETGLDTVAEVDLVTGNVLRRIAAGRNGDGLGISKMRCKLGSAAIDRD